MTATFKVAGTLEDLLLDPADQVTLWIAASTQIVDVDGNVVLDLLTSVDIVDGVLDLDLPADDPSNLPHDPAAAAFGFTLTETTQGRSWTIAAGAAGTTVDLALVTDVWAAPLDTTAEAALLEQVARIRDLSDLAHSAALTAAFAPLADTLALRRLDSLGIQRARRYTGRAAVEYADTTQVTFDHAAIPAIRTGTTPTVTGNKLAFPGTAGGNGAYFPLPRNITPGERFHFSSVIEMAALPSGAYWHFGIDLSDFASVATNGNNYAMIGMGNLQNAGVPRRETVVGAAVNTIVGLSNLTIPDLPAASQWEVSVDGDEDSVSICIRNVGDNTRTHCWAMPVATLLATGKPIGRLVLSTSVNHVWRPIVGWIGSQQPVRTKTVAGLVVEAAAHRDTFKIATVSPTSGQAGDFWRYSVPASYDPRAPAPIALYCHPAQSSATTADRPWALTGMQPLTKALSDAGYIVASAQDGYITGQPLTDRYGNDASMLNFTELYKYLATHFSTGQVVLIGESMGGITMANIIARRTIPNIAAFYGISPGRSFAGVMTANGGAYAAPMRAAYGIAADNSDFAAKTAGHAPELFTGAQLRGVPGRDVVGSTDTIAVPQASIDFMAKIAPYAPEASVLTVAGGHLPAAAYSASDLMTFLNKHVA